MAGDENFHESFQRDDVKMPSDRSTGLVFAVVAAIVAIIWRQTPEVFWTAGSICVELLAVSLLFPKVLRPLNIVWFRFGMLLHKVINPLVMFVLFAGVIVPAGLAMQLVRDPLRKKRQPGATSYWIERDAASETQSSMSNQF
jgi:hypothetical protein